MSSKLGGCWRVLREDLRLLENTGEREREGSGWVRTSCVLSQESQANLRELWSESAEGWRRWESLWQNSNYNRVELTRDTIGETKPGPQTIEENIDG